jgi:colanic acid biosynthesis glycosyl transferase WcaI
MGDLTLDLKAMGHEVFVITTVPHFNEDVKALSAQPLGKYCGKLVQISDYCGIKILHVWMPRKGRNKILRIIAWLGFHFISTISGLLTRFKPDVVLAPSPPLTIGVSAWLIGLRHKCPFIYNVQEIYPDVAVNLGVLRNKFIIRFFQHVESFVYDKARALAVISDGMASHIRIKGIPEKKIHIIPNFVDVKDFYSLPKINNFSCHYGIHDKFVVSYAGNMGAPQGLETLIEAADFLRQEKNIHILIMGDGSERSLLMEKAKDLKLTNITFLPYQPYSLMAEAYAAADASIVSQARGTANDGVPSKVYRIMACARPVIACTDADSDLASLVMKSEGGVVVQSGDVMALANAIRQAFFHHDIWMEKGLKGQNFVHQNYARSKISALYNRLITILVRKGVRKS